MRFTVDRARAVSIHAFRGEGDAESAGDQYPRTFQSTPSGGKATVTIRYTLPSLRVSIHAFRGEGDQLVRFDPQILGVSIHAFRGEGDVAGQPRHRRDGGFNPRLPGGRRHHVAHIDAEADGVSIHAFRGEGDRSATTTSHAICGFNPRLPGGRRRDGRTTAGKNTSFNPRLPGGRRPILDGKGDWLTPFQSTPSGGKATRLRD